MSNLISSNCILCFDHKTKNTCILSTTEKDKIIFPTFRIESAKYFYNENRYLIKNLFSDENLKLVEDIVVSTIDVQNELYIQYLNELKTNIYDEDHDIVILNVVILAEKYASNLFWRKYDHVIDIQNKDIFGLLIDYILQRTVL